MRRIASEIDYLLRRVAVALAVVMAGVAFTLVGSATAAAGDKDVKEVKEVKIEKELKELKEVKEDSNARFDRNRVFFNRNENNRVFFNRNPFFIRPFDIDDELFEERID